MMHFNKILYRCICRFVFVILLVFAIMFAFLVNNHTKKPPLLQQLTPQSPIVIKKEPTLVKPTVQKLAEYLRADPDKITMIANLITLQLLLTKKVHFFDLCQSQPWKDNIPKKTIIIDDFQSLTKVLAEVKAVTQQLAKNPQAVFTQGLKNTPQLLLKNLIKANTFFDGKSSLLKLIGWNWALFYQYTYEKLPCLKDNVDRWTVSTMLKKFASGFAMPLVKVFASGNSSSLWTAYQNQWKTIRPLLLKIKADTTFHQLLSTNPWIINNNQYLFAKGIANANQKTLSQPFQGLKQETTGQPSIDGKPQLKWDTPNNKNIIFANSSKTKDLLLELKPLVDQQINFRQLWIYYNQQFFQMHLRNLFIFPFFKINAQRYQTENFFTADNNRLLRDLIAGKVSLAEVQQLFAQMNVSSRHTFQNTLAPLLKYRQQAFDFVFVSPSQPKIKINLQQLLTNGNQSWEQILRRYQNSSTRQNFKDFVLLFNYLYQNPQLLKQLQASLYWNVLKTWIIKADPSLKTVKLKGKSYALDLLIKENNFPTWRQLSEKTQIQLQKLIDDQVPLSQLKTVIEATQKPTNSPTTMSLIGIGGIIVAVLAATGFYFLITRIKK